MDMYRNEELVDMLLIYGECHKNQRRAAQLYAQRFPDRRHPGHGFFNSLHTRLCRNGTLHASTRPRQYIRRAERQMNAVREAVLANPHTSTRAVGRDLAINHIKVHRILKNELKWHPFKRHTSQRLLPGDFLRRDAFCDWLLEQVCAKQCVIRILKNVSHVYNYNLSYIYMFYNFVLQVDIDNIVNDVFLKNILYTDECTFHNDGNINRHNEHHYAEENPHCRKEIHIQGQFHVNVWMGILNDKVIGPYFFPDGVNINGEIYAAFLENSLGILLEEKNMLLAQNPDIIFQQDGHPAHTSLAARNVLNRMFPHKWIGIHSCLQEWPPRSPDLTPLDFFAWGYMRDQIYQTLPINRNDLINKIQIASANITPAMLTKVRESIMRRVALCAEQNGGYFEHLL